MRLGLEVFLAVLSMWIVGAGVVAVYKLIGFARGTRPRS